MNCCVKLFIRGRAELKKPKWSFGIRKKNGSKILNSKLERKRSFHVFISPLCLTCIEYIIEIKRLREVFTALGIKVTFYCEGSKKEARTLKNDFHLPYRVISIDHKSQKWISSNVSVTPFYVLKNKNGEVLFSGRFTENWAKTKSLLLEEHQNSKAQHA